jgi:hypothetical protein
MFLLIHQRQMKPTYYNLPKHRSKGLILYSNNWIYIDGYLRTVDMNSIIYISSVLLLPIISVKSKSDILTFMYINTHSSKDSLTEFYNYLR